MSGQLQQGSVQHVYTLHYSVHCASWQTNEDGPISYREEAPHMPTARIVPISHAKP